MPDFVISSDWEIPGVYADFLPGNVLKSLANRPVKAAIIAQRLSSGTIGPNVVKEILSPAMASEYFGEGSMAHFMAKQFRKINKRTELHIVTVNEAGGGTAAAGTITITGPATASGTLYFLIAGEAVEIGVAKDDVQNDIAAAIEDAINAKTYLPVTASAADNVVTVTCRWKGLTGNDIDIRINHYLGQDTPAGLTVAIVQPTGGATNPSISTALTALADDQYNHIAFPFTDTTNLGLLEEDLLLRWGPTNAKDGHAYIAYDANFSDTSTFSQARNSPFVSCLPSYKSPSPSFGWAAAICAAAISYSDPTQPIFPDRLTGILAPKKGERFTDEEFNLFLKRGVSHYTIDQDGTVRVGKLVTMYQKNENNVTDDSFKPHRVPVTLSYVRYYIATLFKVKYPKSKLSPNNDVVIPNQRVMTPRKAAGEVYQAYLDLERAGILVNVEENKDAILAAVDANNLSRLNAESIVQIIGHFEQLAHRISFVA